MDSFTPLPALLGGALIGVAASLLLFTHGRAAGISDIFGGLLRNGESRGYRLAFVAGLALAGLLLALIWPGALPVGSTTPPWVVGAAGLLVGYGSRLGSGCTSGHGVYGLSRLSARSLVATLTFMTTAAAVVFITHHVLGVHP